MYSNFYYYLSADDSDSDSEAQTPLKKSLERDSVEPQLASAAIGAVEVQLEDDESEDSIDWGSDSSSSDESTDEDDKNISIRERFLKK